MKAAGDSTRAMARERRKTRRLILYGTLGIALSGCIAILWMTTYNKKMVAALGATGAVILMAAMIGVFLSVKGVMNFAFQSIEQVKKREKDATKGAEGEEAVARILDQLPGGPYLLIHDVVTHSGNRNIDHILLSASGHIYLIETKSHGGTATVVNEALYLNGKPPEKDFVNQVLGNICWLKPKLDQIAKKDTWVDSMIVFSNAFVAPGCCVKKITVINKQFLEKKLRQIEQSPAKVNLWPYRAQIEALLRGSARDRK